MINVEDYIPLVHKLTSKRYEQFKHKYSYDDLFQNACIGLIEAARRFDENKGVKFITFAYQWIDGYLLKSIRDDKWFLSNRQNRFTASAPVSLDNILITKENGCEITYFDILSTDDDNLDSINLEIAIKNLPKKLKTIIRLRYFADMSQSEVAKLLGMAQSNVSKWERKAIDILRREIA